MTVENPLRHEAVKSSAAAFALWGLLASTALAQPATGQQPPLKPDAGTTAQIECIDEHDGYKAAGKTPNFVIELENKCDVRMTCRVYAYVTSPKGTALGHGTLVLAPKSAGAAAKKTFSMRVKMLSGNSQSTRECRAS